MMYFTSQIVDDFYIVEDILFEILGFGPEKICVPCFDGKLVHEIKLK